ncbi:nucleolar complex-associated protein 3 [Coprinopsis cinerea okayama7|uniref:Nucleolar complex-associated protein 3 n=1 Tax=Coprinopsis cinerea (strain Okayama-7 / 130 / ATCC MYA-4618 / FGSC 9003) TaxID=240176 RepID=A8NFJ0_COPC7|nr:nucleolar complex-associated protein 3 [Coprinopsis cinerea okayama7\|eukprot:XP_001833297.2 nucleolar complex-associated protein 3 [Coprinopsis cinerea okayama7\
MANKASRKRPSNDVAGPSKKRKFSKETSKDRVKGKAKAPKQERLADRGVIPIPVDDEEDVELSDEDMEMLDEFGESLGFLQKLDKKGIARSKKETQRLNELTKPVRQAPKVDGLPPIDSNDEDSDDWSSGVEMDSDLDDDDISLSDDDAGDFSDSDQEMPYELKPRVVKVKDDPKEREVQRLPIKLPDGKVKSSGTRAVLTDGSEDEESEEESEIEGPAPIKIEDGSTGARFGRPAVADVLKTSSRKLRVQLAKEQIAGICNDILADPENSLVLLKRLHSFALSELTVPGETKPVPNDDVVRKLAILSQLAVFKDIIPGYRIRALTDKEKTEKVSQMVARTREWEQGLVSVYQNYLRLLDGEIKARSPLADAAIHCMCILLAEVTHFNFRQNLMACIVARLSKRSWDETSERCLNTLNSVFRADQTGEASLEIVRILNRMVKERRFKIHPNVLSCLLNLRLRTELNVRASQTTAEVPDSKEKKKRKKKSDQPHLSKKAKKMLKERKEIEKEMREAEAEVDKEARSVTHTETLKLLFVLYFRILKHPTPSPLLPAALSGIAKFAHLVNIDFFRDLMKVLKELMATGTAEDDTSDAELAAAPLGDDKRTCHRLLCISTAFELLSGQGEALNIDLSDFISELYAMLLPLSLLPNIDAPHSGISVPKIRPSSADQQAPSIADLLFNTLNIVFSPRSPGSSGLGSPPWRAAAFAKRLLIASLHWPPAVSLRALSFVRALVARHPKLEGLLSTEDRTHNGIYRADVDDPQLCHALESSFYELHLLQKAHINPRVGEEARRILDYSS